MQVQLLNLLKVIFQQTEVKRLIEDPANRKDAKKDDSVLKKLHIDSLTESLIQGMQSEVSFVRFHFI